MALLLPKRCRVGIRPEEHVCLDARRHSAVLFRPLARAVLFSVAGIVLLVLPWPALVAVVGWDRTRVVVTTEKVFLVRGITRRHASAVMLRSVRIVALEQTLPGRVLGYGTLQAGPLEVEYVPHARDVRDLVERLAA
jgi:hypothetical protein